MAIRRTLLALATLAVAALGLVLLTAFAWPEAGPPPPPSALNIGPIDQFEAGTAVAWRFAAEDHVEGWVIRTPRGSERMIRLSFWVARLETGEVRALFYRSPFQGCTIPWRDTLQLEGRVGFFRDPCHGATFTLDGRWVDGPSLRDMDWFPVHLEADGDVIVDLTEAHAGEVHHGVPSWDRPRPQIDGWSAP